MDNRTIPTDKGTTDAIGSDETAVNTAGSNGNDATSDLSDDAIGSVAGGARLDNGVAN